MRTFVGIIVTIAAIPVCILTAIATTLPHCGEGCDFGDVTFSAWLVGAFFAATTYLTGLGLIADGPEGLGGSDPYANIEAMHQQMERVNE